MNRTLIIKELRQHGLAFVLLFGLLLVGLLLTTAAVALREEGSLLDALRMFLVTFVVVGLLIVCNRLVVHEYQGRTQLFLEALPLTRLRMVSVKFVLGLTLLAGFVTCVGALLLLASARSEALTWRFVGILAARTYAYLLCAYAFFFMMGLLGRYRIVLYVLLILATMFVATETTLEIARFGPIALVDQQFAYERQQYPVTALITTLGLSTGFIGTILMLSLIREGSVAALLAEKMSHREKVFVTLLVLAVLLAITVYDKNAPKEPLDMSGVVVDGRGVTVTVMAGDAEDSAAREFAETLHGNLAACKDYLELSDMPRIFVIQGGDLDADKYERAEVERAEGILVRADFEAADFDARDFTAWLTRETLVTASHGRATWEPRMWILDGFASYWARRCGAATPAGQYDQLSLRAAYGAECGFSEQDARRWLSYRERVGQDIAAAVACSGLDYLARTCGDQHCRDFLRAVFRADVPGDVRGAWHEWRLPWPRLLQETCGLSAEEFGRQWVDELNRARQTLAEPLARVPKLNGELTAEPLSPLTRKVTCQLTATPPPESGRFRLLHTELGAFDSEVPQNALQEEEWGYADARRGELPHHVSRGTRLYWTFAVSSELLGCDVISGWRRQEIR